MAAGSLAGEGLWEAFPSGRNAFTQGSLWLHRRISGGALNATLWGNYFRESETTSASGYCSPVISLYKQWLRITVRRASVSSHGEGHHCKVMTWSSLLSRLCTFSFLPVDMTPNFKSCSSSLDFASCCANCLDSR